jgi:hypothetical protein
VAVSLLVEETGVHRENHYDLLKINERFKHGVCKTHKLSAAGLKFENVLARKIQNGLCYEICNQIVPQEINSSMT